MELQSICTVTRYCWTNTAFHIGVVLPAQHRWCWRLCGAGTRIRHCVWPPLSQLLGTATGPLPSSADTEHLELHISSHFLPSLQVNPAIQSLSTDNVDSAKHLKCYARICKTEWKIPHLTNLFALTLTLKETLRNGMGIGKGRWKLRPLSKRCSEN